MKKYRNILIVCLLLPLISCKGKNNVSQNNKQPDISKSIQNMPGEEQTFISDGCINITKKLDVRDAPTADGKILYQSSFGDCYKVWEERGSKKTENGVFDLWFKISADKEEWINALYAKKFPFFISSSERIDFKNEYNEEYRKMTMKIEGYRETGGKKELMAKVEGFDRKDTSFYTSVEFRGFVELQEEYSFPTDQKVYKMISGNIQSEYKITLLDNMFENLRSYSSEMEKIGELYNRHIDEEDEPVYKYRYENYTNIDDIDTNDVDYEDYLMGYIWRKTIVINSPEIVLTGIRVGSKGDDVFVQFGNDFTSLSVKYTEQITYSLGYHFNNGYYPIRIIFVLNDDRVVRIVYSMVLEK
jgi:hypothetical protein